jgi:hypothetical protein
VTLLAIFALLVGSAAAQDTPPAAIGDTPIVVTQPADTGDIPVPPVVTVPDNPAPAVLLQPDLQVQAMLIKQVKIKIELYGKTSSKWQRLLHLRLAPISGLSAETDLDTANAVLGKVKARSQRLHAAAKRLMRQRIPEYRETIEHWRLVMGLRPVVRTLALGGSLEEQFLRVSRQKAQTYKQYSSPPHEAEFHCIHHYEGSWTDTGAPFWGGLQMDWGFMKTYGGYLLATKGTANHWTPLEQIWVAEKAFPSRGFYPWPNTARDCGLI